MRRGSTVIYYVSPFTGQFFLFVVAPLAAVEPEFVARPSLYFD